MKTKLEIINETIAFYNLGNRSVSITNMDGRCLYKGPEGKECAFARMCNDWDKIKLEEGNAATDLIKLHTDSILKEEYRGHELEFYQDIQRLHDTETNWTHEGLSVQGERYVKELKKRYKINDITGGQLDSTAVVPEYK
jgi:hypothetical protein